MTPEELSTHDGRDGQKAYVAVSGVIYDVTESPKWADGDHLGQHQAGQDLTEELKSAPHVRAVVERFPVVGRLELPEEVPTGGGNAKLVVGIILAVVIIGLALIVLL